MDFEFLKILIPVGLAVGGWIFTFWIAERNRLRAQAQEVEKREIAAQEELRRQARETEIAHLNDQIHYFYGPMYALVKAGDMAWTAFWNIYQPSHGRAAYFVDGIENTEEELARWRIWVSQVFRPHHKQIERIILDHTHLVEGGVLNDVYLELLAHIKCYEGVIAQWQTGDTSRHVSTANFPGEELTKTIEETYFELLEKREKLIVQGRI